MLDLTREYMCLNLSMCACVCIYICMYVYLCLGIELDGLKFGRIGFR